MIHGRMNVYLWPVFHVVSTSTMKFNFNAVFHGFASLLVLNSCTFHLYGRTLVHYHIQLTFSTEYARYV
jgi:hypothetical protein